MSTYQPTNIPSSESASNHSREHRRCPVAISAKAAFFVYLMLGLAFHAWGVVWVLFLIPGLVRVIVGPSHCSRRRVHHEAAPSYNAKPYPYED